MIEEVTIISIWNKKEQFLEFVENLSNQQKVKIKLVDIDNSENQFQGAREAYNSVLWDIDTEYVLFVHPDIVFLNEFDLFNILTCVKSIGSFGVVGVAGCKEGKKWELLSNILHGKNKENAGKVIKEIEEVQTVDECLFIMRRNFLKNAYFSALSGWHLYAVEQCLSAIANGYKNYIIPIKIWHKSAGNSLEASYMKTLDEIIQVYGTQHIYINTTVKQWGTEGGFAVLYRKYYYLKQTIKKYVKDIARVNK